MNTIALQIIRSITLALVMMFALTTLTPRSTAQIGVPLWTNRYNGPAGGSDTVTALALDSGGNVFAVGYSESTNGGSSRFDYTIVKYSNSGAPFWTNRYLGPASGLHTPRAVAVDGSGNVLVTGTSRGASGYDEYATVAFSTAGVPLWTNRYHGPGTRNDYASAVAVDGSGNVFVTGYAYATNDYADYVTIKYSSAGVPLWTNRYEGAANGSDYAYAIGADGNGDVFVAGGSAVNISYDFATIKYSGAGVALWTNFYIGPANNDDQARALVVDGNGNVIVSGNSVGNGSKYDYGTVAYSSEGVPLWTNRYDGPGSGNDFVRAMAIDPAGNVFVTGSSTGTNGLSDHATVSYSATGVPLWTNRYDGPGNDDDSANAVAVDSAGNAFVTGYATDTNGFTDLVTIAYSGTGVPLWTNFYDGPAKAYDGGIALKVDGSGNVFVAGTSDGVGAGRDYATIKYSPTTPPVQLAIQPDGNGGFFVRLTGVPQVSYLLQRAPNVTGAWSNLATNAASAAGFVEFHDSSPLPGQSYYRSMRP